MLPVLIRNKQVSIFLNAVLVLPSHKSNKLNMDKSTVAVYSTNEKAIKAVKHLVTNGIPEEELSIVGEGQLVEDHIHFVPVKQYKKAPLFVGIVCGGVLGLLAGAGIIDIPFMKSVDDSGGFIGLLSGVVLGSIVGAAISILISLVIRKDDLVILQKHIDNGHYAVVVKGSEGDILRAKELLNTKKGHTNMVHLKSKG